MIESTRIPACAAFVMLCCLVGCAEQTKKPEEDPEDPCTLAAGALPAGLVELAWDDGTAVSDISAQTWPVEGEPLATATLNEAVRFDLAHPAKIHGFGIQWAHLPQGGASDLCKKSRIQGTRQALCPRWCPVFRCSSRA